MAWGGVWWQSLAEKVPNGHSLLSVLPDPLETISKLPDVTVPLLVMHGEQDNIVPVAQGLRCYEGVSSMDKRFKRFPRANHNNLYRSQPHEFTKELEHFMDLVFKPVAPGDVQVRVFVMSVSI